MAQDTHSKGSSTMTKTFAQALSNSCNIPTSKLSKPCLKGKGYFEFIFSSLDDLSAVRSIGFWNFSLGLLRTFAWSADFNPYTVPPTNAQTWIRIHGLAREYWLPRILFEIVGALGSPLALDEATKKINFGHFARILIDVDLSSNLHERILVERNVFDFYVDVEYENIPPFCNSCQIIGNSVNNCKYQTPTATTNSTTVNKPRVRQNTSNVEKPIEGPAANITADRSKNVVEIDPLVDDMIRSKEANTYMFVGDILNHDNELISFEAVHVCVPDTSSSNGMTSLIVGDGMNFANEAFCEELHEEEKVVVDSIPLDNQDRSIVVPDSNLSNFNANVIHNMQVLGLLSAPTAAQQTMDFLSNYWANMTQTKEVVDSVGNMNQQFQLVVPKNRKNKVKQKQVEASKGFKVALSIHSHLVVTCSLCVF
ncbi:hypothetical protein TSUD_194760 [Trifolium subterraneum]|uniref:Uncharacterized protein n=1 Tax=Trifolium subterraneum TaxID=3900 RepID=A0A2Z6P192_TRISU|nr:hypothetical protein TSUD_194760 [Trifolium subterraneum]